MSEAIENLESNPNLFFNILDLFNVFLGPVYMLLSLNLLRKHKRSIANDFSYTEKIDLIWLRYVIIAMVLVWISVILVHIIGEAYYSNTESNLGNDIIYIMVTLTVFFYGFFGIKQQIIYLAPSTGNPKKSKIEENRVEDAVSGQYQKSGLKKEESEKLLKSLVQYMEEETPYLDGKLSLKQVALKLNISSNYLSQVINENLQKNFFDFVNEYRVEVFKEKMNDQENKQFTLLALAYDCGFNSKSSFNSIFKKFTGLTPTQYQSQVG
jgi:AraC-like DNA-binding protein